MASVCIQTPIENNGYLWKAEIGHKQFIKVNLCNFPPGGVVKIQFKLLTKKSFIIMIKILKKSEQIPRRSYNVTT